MQLKRLALTALLTALCAASLFSAPTPPAKVKKDFLDLQGDWHFKVYRKYDKMFQYFAYGGCAVTWEDREAARLPEAAQFNAWESFAMPANDYATGGLLQLTRGGVAAPDTRTALVDTDLFPKWSEAWFCREIQVPKGFLKEGTVTLLLGIIDDLDVVYVNGQPVAASGFKTRDGQAAPARGVPALGGFDANGDFQFEKSYWEVPREYAIPAALLHEGANQICIRLYNNNSFGGFYNRTMALSSTRLATRWLKGMPIDSLPGSGVYAKFVERQRKAIEAKDIAAYAATIADNYHQNEFDKAKEVARMQALFAVYDSLSVEDGDAGFYLSGGQPCYTADRLIIGLKGETRTVIQKQAGYFKYFTGKGDRIQELGNWSHCYTVSYTSTLPAMKGKTLSYSVYLPPSYYKDPGRRYPTVYLLHGINSTGRSFVDVDQIEDRLDSWIAGKEICEMVVVMPDAGKMSYYKDSEGGPSDSQGPWASFISVDILGQIEGSYRVLQDAKFRALTGISMGGGGVFGIGMANLDTYSSFASLMGYLPEAAGSLAGLPDEAFAGLDFYLDCGLQDAMVDPQLTKSTAEYLLSRKARVIWELRDGGHNSAFYSVGLLRSMRMHSGHFIANGYTGK